MDINIRKTFSTYMPLLIRTLDVSSGTVYEFGAGVYSTPLLHWYTLNQQRNLWTFEENQSYFDMVKDFESNWHKVILVNNWNQIKVEKVGLLFIDHGVAGEDCTCRGKAAIKFKDAAEYIVLHDTEEQCAKVYGYNKVWPQFKYRYDWRECLPYTSVVSNIHDVLGGLK